MKAFQEASGPSQEEASSSTKDVMTISPKHDTTKMPNFIELMGTDMVDITVGPDKKLFRVYKKLLCDKVPYFAKMFGTGFKEALEGTADFPEDNPQSFGLLMEWIYFGKFTPLELPLGTKTFSWDPYNFYGLAEKLCIVEVKDKIMDQILEQNFLTRTFPKPHTIRKSYALTATGSPIRRYTSQTLRRLVSWTDCDIDIRVIHEAMQGHDDLGRDVLTLMRKDPIGLDPSHSPKCSFHHHGKDEPCPYRC